MSTENDRAPAERPGLSESDALKEVVRVMLGFQSREQMEEVFRKEIVRKAISNLEQALELTRARRQPDEFALTLAIEIELLRQAREAGHDLEALFNDPNHHMAPSSEITSLIEKIWAKESGA